MEEVRAQSRYFPDITAVPVAVWVRLLADLQPFLSEFASSGLALLRWRAPVLPDEMELNQARRRLVDYFQGQSFNRCQAEELPWLLHRLENWPEQARAFGE